MERKAMSEFELRRVLADLPRERSPANDLWPGVAAGMTSRGPESAAAGADRSNDDALHYHRRRSRRASAGRWLAAAAALVLMLGLGQILQRTAAPSSGAVQRADHALPLIADAVAYEYQAAIATLPPQGVRAPALQDADAELEQATAELRAALDQSPHSIFLLDQLRRTYALRLRLQRNAHIG